MNYQEQAEAVFGSDWLWRDAAPKEKSADWMSLLLEFNQRRIHDVNRLHLFINFVLWRAGEPNFFSAYEPLFRQSFKNDAESKNPVAWLTTLNMILFLLDDYEEQEHLKYYPGDRSASSVDWWGLREDGVELPTIAGYATIHYFDRIEAMATIKHHTMSPEDIQVLVKKTGDGFFEAVETPGFNINEASAIMHMGWASPSCSSDILVVDPRIPFGREDEFAAAKQVVARRAGKEVVFAAGDFARTKLPDEVFFKESMHAWKQFLQLSPFRRSVVTPQEVVRGSSKSAHEMKIQKLRDFAKEELGRAREFIRGGSFREAIVVVNRACKQTLKDLHGDEGPDDRFSNLLAAKKELLRAEYGYAVFSDLMEIKNTRNRAEHDDKYKPDAHAANAILSRGEIVLNSLLRNK